MVAQAVDAPWPPRLEDANAGESRRGRRRDTPVEDPAVRDDMPAVPGHRSPRPRCTATRSSLLMPFHAIPGLIPWESEGDLDGHSVDSPPERGAWVGAVDGGGVWSSEGQDLPTASPTSAGSHRAPLSTDGPWCQPSATPILPPSTSNIAPVTSVDSRRPQPLRPGATRCRGPWRRTGPPSTAAIMSVNTPSVMRVRAAGQMALAVIP